MTSEESMATEVANREEGNSQIRKSINDWKYPKIPIDQVYKKRVLKISPSYAVKDFEDTITVNSNNKSAMVDLSPEALKEPVLGETTYFQPAIGTRCITKWDEADLQVHESTTNEVEPKPDDRVLKKGSSISAKFGSEKESSSKNRTSLEDWNYPKTPVKQVYNSRKHYMYMDSESSKGLSLWSKAKIVVFQTSPPTVKDYEKTVTLKANDQINVPINLLEGLIKGEKRYIHLEAPVIVCVRDGRMIKFQESLNALVKANLSEGPFYFSCSPGHSICSEDHKFFKVNVMSGVPLVLTYRVVCNVTTGLTSDYRNSLTRGETTYYQSNAGTERTTIWDEVQLPESWTCS
ncbi:ORF I: Movement protein [Bienertia sinuspersici]